MRNIYIFLISLLIFTGCSAKNQSQKQNQKEDVKVIACADINGHEASLTYKDGLRLQYNGSEALIGFSEEDYSKDMFTNYSILELGNDIIGLVDNTNGVDSNFMNLELYSYADGKLIKIWGLDYLAVKVLSFQDNTYEIQFLNYDFKKSIALSPNEVQLWKDKQESNNLIINEELSKELADKVNFSPRQFKIKDVDNDSTKELIMQLTLHSLGSLTPLINQIAVIEFEISPQSSKIKAFVVEGNENDDKSLLNIFN